MRIKDFNKKIFILLGQFIVLFLGIIYLDYVYLMNIRPDQLAKQRFRQTQCLVMSKKLSAKGKIIRRYRADFLVSYYADGVQYNRWVSGNGLDRSHSAGNTTQEKLLTDYDNGHNYTCWFNPENPGQAFLIPRQTWLTLSNLLIAALVFVVTGFFIKNGLLLLGVIRETRSLKKENKLKK